MLVNLADRLFCGPHVVVGPRLHDRDAAICQWARLRLVEYASKPHVQRARNNSDVLDAGVPMRRNVEVGSKLSRNMIGTAWFNGPSITAIFTPGSEGRSVQVSSDGASMICPPECCAPAWGPISPHNPHARAKLVAMSFIVFASGSTFVDVTCPCHASMSRAQLLSRQTREHST